MLALRILLVLRNTHRITNKYLVDANAFLRERYEDPWTDLTFHTLNKRVYFDNPSSDEVTESAKIGQLPLPATAGRRDRACSGEDPHVHDPPAL